MTSSSNNFQIHPAYILTGNYRDTPTGCELVFVASGPEGPLEIIIKGERPLFFVLREAQLQSSIYSERKQVALTNMTGKAVDALYFNSQKELYSARNELARIGVRTMEADIRPEARFLMEHFINAGVEILGNWQTVDGMRRFVNPQLRPGDYRPQLAVASIDIETSLGDDLYSIAVHFTHRQRKYQKVFMVGTQDNTDEVEFYPDEKRMYLAFQSYFQQLDPDIIIGWHIIGFDLKFLATKCQKWKIPFALGRRGRGGQIVEGRNGGFFAHIEGRIVIDGPTCLRTNLYSFQNFKLQTVAQKVLGRGKDITATRTADKAAEITHRFEHDKLALAKYNLLDAVLVTDIFEKLQLLQLLVERTLNSGLLLEQAGQSIAAFDHLFLPHLHRKGRVASNAMEIKQSNSTDGALVLEPVTGNHQHIVVLDFKSLYPSIIRTFKVDPYSRIMAHIDTLETPAGIKFSRTHHLLPNAIEKLMKMREKAKKKNLSQLALSIKLLMNSFYGVMGSANSRFYHSELSAAITGSGRWILNQVVEFLQGEKYQVVYGDTDSVFIKLKEDEWTTPFEKGERLALQIGRSLNDLIQAKFNVKSYLSIEFEKYFRRFHLPPARSTTPGTQGIQGIKEGAKKRYAGLLVDRSGKEQLNFVGMEVVRSDWTAAAKEFQYKIFDMLFHEQKIDDFIRNFVEKIKKGEFDHKLVYTKRLTKPLTEYQKHIPPHIKAARLAQQAGIPLEREISYVITHRGPMPVEMEHSDMDYQHYVSRQIKPLADNILAFDNKNFDNIMVGNQLSLF